MFKPLSNSQVARLGGRLRDGVYSADDLKLLSEYGALFAPALKEVVQGIAKLTSVQPTERPAKSIQSIIYKLQRLPTTRLDSMQDMAGCRLVVGNTFEQDDLAESMMKLFCDDPRLIDLRQVPHAGYRAEHVVVKAQGRRVEVQIRTELQDSWAQCSEHWAFKVDPAIKYGGGPKEVRGRLERLSTRIRQHEEQFASRFFSAPFFSDDAPYGTPQFWEEFVASDAKLKAWLLEWKRGADLYQPPEGS